MISYLFLENLFLVSLYAIMVYFLCNMLAFIYLVKKPKFPSSISKNFKFLLEKNILGIRRFVIRPIGIVFIWVFQAGHELLLFVLGFLGIGWELLAGTSLGLPMAFSRRLGGVCIQCDVKTSHKIYSTYLIEFMKKNDTNYHAVQTYSRHWNDTYTFERLYTLKTYESSALESLKDGKIIPPHVHYMYPEHRFIAVSSTSFVFNHSAVFVCDSSCKKEFVAEWKNHAILLDLKDKAQQDEWLEKARLKKEEQQDEARLKREARGEKARRKAEAALAKKMREENAALAKKKAAEAVRLRKAKEKEAEEDAVLAKKKAAALQQLMKKKQAEAVHLRNYLESAKEKEAEEHSQSILNVLMEQDVHPDFISDLTEIISSSVMIRYEFRDVLLSLWSPLGKPKKSSAYHYWQGWVLANADYSVDIEETKSSILKLIKTTIHEMQKLIPDLMDLVTSIDHFDRLVGLWEKHDHLGHNVISRIFQGENETFVLADIDALQR